MQESLLEEGILPKTRGHSDVVYSNEQQNVAPFNYQENA